MRPPWSGEASDCGKRLADETDIRGMEMLRASDAGIVRVGSVRGPQQPVYRVRAGEAVAGELNLFVDKNRTAVRPRRVSNQASARSGGTA